MSKSNTPPAAPHYLRRSLILALIALGAWLTLLANDSKNKSADWSDIRQGLEAELQARDRSFSEAEAFIPKIEHAVSNELEFVSVRVGQLVMLRGLAGSSAWPWRCLGIQEQALQTQALALRGRIGHLETAIKDDLLFLGAGIETVTRLQELLPDHLSQERAQEIVDKLTALQTRGMAVDAKIAELVAPLDTGLTKLERITAQSYALSRELFEAYYAEPSRSVLSKVGRVGLGIVVQNALQPTLSFHATLRHFFSQTRFVGLWLAATLTIGSLLTYLGSKHWGKGRFDMMSTRLRYGRWTLAAGLALLISLLFDPYATTPTLLCLKAGLFVSGITLMALGLHVPGAPTRPLRKEPLILLLGLFWMALIVSLPGFPSILVSALWSCFAALGSVLLWLSSLNATAAPSPHSEADVPSAQLRNADETDNADNAETAPSVEPAQPVNEALVCIEGMDETSPSFESCAARRFTRFLSLVLAALTALSLAGYGPHALFASQLLFILLLAGKVAALLNQFWKHGARAEASSAASASFYPLALAALSALAIGGALEILGGTELAGSILNIRVGGFGATVSVRSLLACGLTFLVLRLILAWITALFGADGPIGKKLESGQSHTLRVALSYSLYLGFLLVALSILGIELSSLTWIASGLSVGIGFGLKDIVNNFVSGLIILFGGVVRRGDILQQGKTLGEVVDISMRNTTIRTLDNTMVIIPNSRFLSGEIVNLSYADAKMKVTIPITVAPGTKIKKMEKLLLSASKASEYVLPDPAPQAEFARFNRQGLEFELSFWVDHFLKKSDAEAAINKRIDKLLQEAKIMVAFQGVKFKYKPKGKESDDLEAKREELREKRKEMLKLVRGLSRKAYMRRVGI